MLFSCLCIVVTYYWHFDCYTTPVNLYFKISAPLKRIKIGSYVVYVYIASFMNKKKSVAICIIDNIRPGLGILCLVISTWYPYYLWQKKVELNDGYLFQAIFVIHSFVHFVHNKVVVSKLTLLVVFVTCFSFKRLILLYMLYKRLRSL